MRTAVYSRVAPYINRHTIVFLCIIALAVFLRTYRLSEIPHGFYVEEMTNAYIGRYILLHGRDIYGNMLPLVYFNKFGDYAPVLPLYLSGAATFLFGVTEFAARIPIALIGVLGIVPIYFLGTIIFGKKLYGLVAASFIAVSPWHIVLSRTTAEGIVGLTLYSFGLWSMVEWYLNKRPQKLILSVVLFFICYFVYPGLRILVPMTIVPFVVYTWRNKHEGTRIIVWVTVFFFILTLGISMTVWGRARFAQTSLLTNEYVREQLSLKNEYLAGADNGNIPLARIFHNKPVAYMREFARQYLTYFSPLYLFYEGGGQYRYYNVPEQGIVLLTFGIVIAAALIPHKRYPLYTIVIYLLIVSPLSSAITIDFTPHVHRSVFMIIPLAFIATYGWIYISRFRLGKFVYASLLIIPLTLELVYFWHMYAGHSPSFQSSLRNDGDRELVTYVRDNRTLYDAVYMPAFERLPLYYLFYTGNFSDSFMGKFALDLRLTDVDNVHFVNDWCPTKILTRQDMSANSLIIESSSCEESNGFTTNGQIHRKDGSIAYRFFITAPPQENPASEQ